MSNKSMTKSLLNNLTKTKESPIVARKRRKIQKESGLPASKRKIKKTPKEQLVGKSEELEVTDFTQPLAKSEYQITSFKNGDVKLDFGVEVPEVIKKRAMDWLKKRGLKAKEFSLGKSKDGSTWVVFSK